MSLIFFARFWGKWRGGKIIKKRLTTPLVDAAVIEAALTSRTPAEDDQNLLNEMRDTMLHLNRQAYAEEFWNLDEQLFKLIQGLGSVQKSTAQKAMIRLLQTDDPWLQAIAAKSCSRLGIVEAISQLIRILEIVPTDTGNGGGVQRLVAPSSSAIYKEVIEQSLHKLDNIEKV